MNGRDWRNLGLWVLLGMSVWALVFWAALMLMRAWALRAPHDWQDLAWRLLPAITSVGPGRSRRSAYGEESPLVESLTF